MVTIRPGQDDQPGVKLKNDPRFPRLAVILSLFLGGILAAVCFPFAMLIALPTYVLKECASVLGIDTGWSLYWSVVAARIAAFPLYPMIYFFAPEADMDRNRVMPDDDYLEDLR